MTAQCLTKEERMAQCLQLMRNWREAERQIRVYTSQGSFDLDALVEKVEAAKAKRDIYQEAEAAYVKDYPPPPECAPPEQYCFDLHRNSPHPRGVVGR